MSAVKQSTAPTIGEEQLHTAIAHQSDVKTIPYSAAARRRCPAVTDRSSVDIKYQPSPWQGIFHNTSRQGGGGSMRPNWRFETKRRSASRKRPIDCSRRVLAIGGIFFEPRSTFDLVIAGQRSIFGEIDVFFNFTRQYSDGAITDIVMKSLSSCLVDNWHHFACLGIDCFCTVPVAA